MDTRSNGQPVVGLLYNPAVPYIIDQVGDLVQYIEVIPDRFWYDFGTDAQHGRFHWVHDAVDTLRRCAGGRVIAGHGIGLSLPSAMPLDAELLDQVAAIAEDIGFSWYSEHMSMFLTPHSSIPNAQAGLGLPVVYDMDTFEILRAKIRQLKDALGCPLLMENGSIFTPIPYVEMTEPEFFNRLYDELDCGMLLDLHNLYVSWRNGAASPEDYLEELNPDAVLEIHMAGGDELAGFYTDSHSRLTPPDVWTWAREYVPRFTRLKAITFEFHESYFSRLGVEGIAGELERLHDLAASCSTVKSEVYA
ncbi:MAG TPA: DUF692 family protein [Pyrinomonadaceae bacterium]